MPASPRLGSERNDLDLLGRHFRDTTLGIAKVTATPSILASVYRQYGAAVFQEAGDGNFGGVACDLLKITGSPLDYFLDKETHLLQGMALPNILEIAFADYKVVEGINLPHTTVTSIPIAGLTVSYEYDATTLFNGDLDGSQFEKPAEKGNAQETGSEITYSESQASAGQVAYTEHCAECHGVKLRGTHISPSLVGDRFDQNWRGKTVDVLSFHIRRMPPDEAVTLDDETHTNLIAFLLQANAFAAGGALSSDLEALEKLEIPLLEGATFDPDAPVEASRVQASRLDNLTPVSAEMLANPQAHDWLSWGRGSDGLSYSPLEEINTENVAQLAPAWRTALRPGSSMSMPLVHGGIMFLHAYPDTTIALDAQNGDVLWRYQREMGGRSSQKMGIALFGDKVFVPTSDLHVVALEAKTGKLVWDQAIDIVVPEGGRGGHVLRSAPLIAGGKVIQGVTASFASRGGFLVALDLETGKEAWRFDTIAKPGEPGGNSWNGVPYDKRSGGSVWHQGTYDSELNLVYYGVAPTYDTGPLLEASDEEGITNDALYTNCTIALNPETGAKTFDLEKMPDPKGSTVVCPSVAGSATPLERMQRRSKRGRICGRVHYSVAGWTSSMLTPSGPSMKAILRLRKGRGSIVNLTPFALRSTAAASRSGKLQPRWSMARPLVPATLAPRLFWTSSQTLP